MTPLYGHSETVGRFVAGLIPRCERGWVNFTSIGVLDGESLVAGVIYHNWDPEAGVIEMSAASLTPKWLTRRVLRAIFDFPFRQLDCQMVVLRTSVENSRMRSICRRFGFSEIIIPRLYGRHEDCAVNTLTAEQWAASKHLRTIDG